MIIYLVIELFGGTYQNSVAFANQLQRDKWFHTKVRELLNMYTESIEDVLNKYYQEYCSHTDGTEFHRDTTVLINGDSIER